MKSPPIVLIFSLSTLAILILMAIPIALLYCYHKLTTSTRAGRPRDVELAATVKPRNTVSMPHVVSPKVEKESNDNKLEKRHDLYVVGDDKEEVEDPFGDGSEKGDPSITASISRYYFERPETDRIDPARDHRHAFTGNPWGYSWQTDAQRSGELADKTSCDSFDSVLLTSERPIAPISPKISAPGRSLLR